ncbi:thioredoxin domain-containing protein [Leptobacterium flavescens]|uniref:Thioredoxin domain-containing protein n=1 Tax=Leptobacterium flavescens TaxID=472055 RepID=A0A6P0UNP5_9FLAO|nr:vitamin K epoxide reductase family protein [Leptobacterium flavescens]NER14795.1 thioredoxin domain-containing protein [Leptobacterium flavescens]
MDKLVLKYLVESNYLNIDSQDLKLQLLAHPDYPSLKSITDTLDYFKIENIAASIPKEYLDQLPEHFLTLVGTEEGKQLVMVSRHPSNTRIRIYSDKGHKEKIQLEDFEPRWGPTIIAIEPQKPELDKKIKRISNFKLVGGLLIVASLFLYGWNNFELIPVLYYLLSFGGAYLSFLIAREEMGLNTANIVKLCTKYSNTSCSDVIKSNGAKLFGLVSLSDMAISYSATLILFLLFNGYQNSILMSIGALSVPVLIYSVFYQWYSVKKWCLLCLGIAAVIVTQFSLTLIGNTPFYLPVKEVSFFVFAFAASLFLWTRLKPLIKENHSLRSARIDFMKFKRNLELFTGLLTKKALVKDDKIYDSGSLISFGNPKAPLKIIAITNPLCGFCKASFQTYTSLLDTHAEDIHISFVFNVNYQSENNEGTQISHRLLEKFFLEDEEKCLDAFKEWFQDRNIASWQKKFGISKKLTYKHLLEAQSEWCKANSINYTPATVINGYYFPKEYEIKDLGLFIDELIAAPPAYSSDSQKKQGNSELIKT